MFGAALRSMLSRKLRLILSMVSVVLGVMFVSGSMVLADTLGRSFDQMFTDIYSYTDLEVNRPTVAGMSGGQRLAEIPESLVANVARVPGVDKSQGIIFVDGARVVGKNNKTILGAGGPRFGSNWIGETELTKLSEGRGPTADNEIALSANTVKITGYKVGDQIAVLTPFGPRKRLFTLVGVAVYAGGRDSMAGESTVFFTDAVAQQLMLGHEGVFNAIEVKVRGGADRNTVKDEIVKAIGPEYAVKTGAELAADNTQGFKNIFKYFSYILLGFAGVALFVGGFLILNTFSIIVAQRTRELALFRALGAGRWQIIGSVLVEALIVGLTSTVVGLGLGVGIGALLGDVVGALMSGGALKTAGLQVPWTAVVAAFAVGVGVTVLAALLPAFRAARIAPVAALRDAANPDRPLTRMTMSGGAILLGGGTALGLGLNGKLGDQNLWGVLGGLITCFIGVALLTPIISKPVVWLLGGAFSWSAAGELGRRNALRDPRRTAITSSALMVTIALVTGISVISSSIEASTVKAIDAGIDASLIITADPQSGNPTAVDPKALTAGRANAAIDPKVLAAVRELAGVSGVAGQSVDQVQIDGASQFAQAIDDPQAWVRLFRVEAIAGSMAPIEPGHLLIDDRTAAQKGLQLGSLVEVTSARGGVKQVQVQGIYKRSTVSEGLVFAPADSQAWFSRPAPTQAFVALAPGADLTAIRARVNALIADNPEVSTYTIQERVALQTQTLNTVLDAVQLLLALALIIAVLGIVNTLALSMTERTREVGMLRAIGMLRGQLGWMATVESIVIAVFGAVLGIGVGCGIGAAVVRALRDQGFTELAFRWDLMAIYVVASVFVGAAAGLFPAIKAARSDVLRAIATQ